MVQFTKFSIQVPGSMFIDRLAYLSVICFGVRVSVMFHFMFVHYTFSSVWVAEWPPLGK